MQLSKEQITNSLRVFKSRRDDMLHEDESAFDHHLKRFMAFCGADPLVKSIIEPLLPSETTDVDAWWESITQHGYLHQGDAELKFPADGDEELSFRYRLLKSVVANDDLVAQFGMALGKDHQSEWVEIFRILIVRPFADELSHRLGEAANLASPEARVLQAVPLIRIPSPKEVRIFLSHKTVDKPLVRRYYDALKTLGFDPWLDEPEMAAGANLEREIARGFQESCAAVFFITQNFKDERYLGSEVDYAIAEKRKKDRKFALITLRYADAAEVPLLLRPYVYKTVSNDLEGFNELLRALPIELGPVRWKTSVVAE